MFEWANKWHDNFSQENFIRTICKGQNNNESESATRSIFGVQFKTEVFTFQELFSFTEDVFKQLNFLGMNLQKK